MKVNLEAGNLIIDGYINHDLIKHSPQIELAFNLEDKDWPVEENSADELRAFDVIEHIENVVLFMDNCWKWLKAGGTLNMKACGWQNPNAHVDITHKRPGFDITSFDYFDPLTQIGAEYGYYTNKKWKIIEKNYDRRKNIIIQMMPLKP